jgi:hypothetical protein
MKSRYTSKEIVSAQSIVTHIQNGNITQGIETLEKLKDDVYAAIPDKQRRSRGITWVIQRICGMIVEICLSEEDVKGIALSLYGDLGKTDKLQGVPIFLMGEFGMSNPTEVLEFFEEVANAVPPHLNVVMWPTFEPVGE